MGERIVQKEELRNLRQLEVDFSNLFLRIEKKFPMAFDKFNKMDPTGSNMYERLASFLKSYGLKVSYRKTLAKKAIYEGTFSYKINFQNTIMTRLNLKKDQRCIYNLKSVNSAYEKAMEKSFEFINCYLTGKPVQTKTRNR
jgi:hypothetical protein